MLYLSFSWKHNLEKTNRKVKMNLTRISFFIIISLFFSFSEKTFAATTPASIPSSAEPKQIQRAVTQNIESKQQQQVPTGYPTPEEIQPSSQAPSTAKKIKFKQENYLIRQPRILDKNARDFI